MRRRAALRRLYEMIVIDLRLETVCLLGVSNSRFVVSDCEMREMR